MERSDIDGKSGFALVLVATLNLFPLALSGGVTFVVGFGYWQSAVYALWDSTVAVGMTLGLGTLFRSRFNWSGSSPILTATLIHCLHHSSSHHRICGRCVDGTLSSICSSSAGGGDYCSAMFRGSLSGAEDPKRVEGALT